MKCNKSKYNYNGMSLYDLCKTNPELNYNTLRKFLYRKKSKNPNLTDEEIIKQYIDKKHKGKYRYYYAGVPLKQFCIENDIEYQNLIAYIQYHKNDENLKDLDDDLFIEKIMEQYVPFKPKYFYNGILLIEYCKQNNIPYISIVSYVKRNLAKKSTKSIDELIEEGIKNVHRYGIIYYYDKMPLKDYCKKNDLNYSSIRGAIIKRKANSNEPIQEIVNDCVLAYKKFSIKYMFCGITLRQYCIQIGLKYNTVINKYINEYQGKKDFDTAINEIIDYYKKNPPVNTKYYFSNQSLARFCDRNGYSYSNILRRIRRLQKKKNELDDEEIIKIVISKYENKLYIKETNEIFTKLKNGEIQNYHELKKICQFLKVNFENVLDLINMDFSYNQALNLIWYFSDEKDCNDDKIITDKKLMNLLSFAESLQTKSNDNIEDYELYDLIGLYKSELYDSRNEILVRQKKYISKVIYSLCRNYEVNVNNSNYEDFESEIKYYLLMIINQVNSNIYGQIIKYMDLTIKGYFRIYLKQYKKQNNDLSFDDSKYSSDKGISNEKSMIDYIADPNNPYETEDTSFSSYMMQVLSTLPSEDLSFVMLKYQENYSDEDLSNYFNLTLEEIRQKDIEILSLLKKDYNIKVMRKARKSN